MNFSALHEKLNQYINKGRLKSPWVVHYDCGSCNGCDIEVLACLTPVFDVERFGIVNIGDPKHADVLLVTGTVNQRNKDVLKNLYDQMPEPKAVIAIGACACTGGVFQDCYNVVGGVDHVIPVDVYVPGCAAKPSSTALCSLLKWSRANSDCGTCPRRPFLNKSTTRGPVPRSGGTYAPISCSPRSRADHA